MNRLLLVLVFAGCAGTPTESACPTANAPTYDNFGRDFMTKYCSGCHASTATDRHGAPTSQTYDSEADVRMHALDIDLVAAAGPNANNTAMPELDGPVHVAPTDAERLRLGEYLACMRP